jgi:16S rRNA A1518/A1519 N6-dimethyltransferase RsmA/KsgA/DIM1 with predicted DNA glycosylase/AP lyase activity
MGVMVDDEELSSVADPALGQHFLISPEKVDRLIRAADIQPDDRVLEVGAGAGTIARHMPPCKSLTVVELDTRLIDTLRENVPAARVIEGDALRLASEIPFDVLIGSLPYAVTESLIDVLPNLSFRTAVMTMSESTDLTRLASTFEVAEVMTVSGEDFRPAQPSVSRIVRITRRRAETRASGDRPGALGEAPPS